MEGPKNWGMEMDDPKNGGRVQMNLGNFERPKGVKTFPKKLARLFFTKVFWGAKLFGKK